MIIAYLFPKKILKFQSKNITKALTIIYSLQTSLDFEKNKI